MRGTRRRQRAEAARNLEDGAPPRSYFDRDLKSAKPGDPSAVAVCGRYYDALAISVLEEGMLVGPGSGASLVSNSVTSRFIR